MQGLLVFSFSEELGRLEVFGTAKGLGTWKEKLASLNESKTSLELAPPYIQSFPVLDDDYHRNMKYKYLCVRKLSLNLVPSKDYVLTFEWNTQSSSLEIYADDSGLKTLFSSLSDLIGDESKAGCVDHDHWIVTDESDRWGMFILSPEKQGQGTSLIGGIKPYIMPREHFAKMYQLDYLQYV